MLQPKYAKQLDSNIRELIANGGSKEDIDKMASDYTSLFSDEALKKKESTSVLPQQSSASVQTNGSSGTQDIDPKTGFPKAKPLYNTIPDTQELGSTTTPQQKEYKLKQELSKVKVTPENMEEVSRKTDELSALQKTNQKEALDQKYKYAKSKELEEVGGFEAMSENLKSGVAQAVKFVASVPALAYDAAAFFTNPLMKAIGYEAEEASSKNSNTASLPL